MLYIDGQPFNEFLSELRADINYLKELRMDKEVDIKKEMEAQLGKLFLESRKIQARLQAISEEILHLEKELQ